MFKYPCDQIFAVYLLSTIHLHWPGRFKKTANRVPGKGGLRWYKNVGLGFKTPKEAMEGTKLLLAVQRSWPGQPCGNSNSFNEARISSGNTRYAAASSLGLGHKLTKLSVPFYYPRVGSSRGQPCLERHSPVPTQAASLLAPFAARMPLTQLPPTAGTMVYAVLDSVSSVLQATTSTRSAHSLAMCQSVGASCKVRIAAAATPPHRNVPHWKQEDSCCIV